MLGSMTAEDRLTCPCCGRRFDTAARMWTQIFAGVMHHFGACPAAGTLNPDLRRVVAADLATRSALDDTAARRRRIAQPA
jgi:hypothetical protein